MREIEFRGKSKETGEWLYGDLVHCVDGEVSVFPRVALTDDDVFGVDKFAVDPDTVGQFTGQPDTEGKRIYEGDIISFSPWEYIIGDVHRVSRAGEIVVPDNNCSFMILSGDNYHSLTAAGVKSDDVFVIGNVHDAPELLT